MDHLLRSHAPITEAGWSQLDEEARQRVVVQLAGRKLVDFSGPKGWRHSATELGRSAPVPAPGDNLLARQRRVLPLIELRAPFSVDREELMDADRGAADLELGALDHAAVRIAVAENVAVFHGWQEAGITGIEAASPHQPLPLGTDFARYPAIVARAVELLLSEGVAGPYGLALGPDAYTGVVETTEHGGLIVFDHLRQILGGPIVWAPGVEGAVVVSLRGGDFFLEVGQDLSIGYLSHDEHRVHLYLEETFSFRIASADAAVALRGAK